MQVDKYADKYDEWVAKLLVKLDVINKVNENLQSLTTEYRVNHAKSNSKLESIEHIVTTQNSRIFKLEESTIKDREQHIACTAPLLVAQNIEAIAELKGKVAKLADETEIARHNQRFPERAKYIAIGFGVTLLILVVPIIVLILNLSK